MEELNLTELLTIDTNIDELETPDNEPRHFRFSPKSTESNTLSEKHDLVIQTHSIEENSDATNQVLAENSPSIHKDKEPFETANGHKQLDEMQNKLHSDVGKINEMISTVDTEQIDPSQLQHKIDGLLADLKSIESEVNELQTENFRLSALISNNNDNDAIKTQLIAESNVLQKRYQKLKKKLDAEQKAHQQDLIKLQSELKKYQAINEENEVTSDIKLNVIIQENIRLKQQKMKLQNLFEIQGPTRQESETLCHKMEIEGIERDVETMKDKARNTERFKLRPLHRKLNLLEQQNQDLEWSLHDSQSLADRNAKYLEQIKSQTEKIKNLTRINDRYKQKVINFEDHIERKNREQENIAVEHCEIRKEIQLLSHDFTMQVNDIKQDHDDMKKMYLSRYKNLNIKYKKLQNEDKRLKTTVAENLEYIETMANTIDHKNIKQYLDKINQIDEDLKTMLYYTIGTNNIANTVRDSDSCDKTETITEEVIGMIEKEFKVTKYESNLDSSKSKATRNPMPPRPPTLAITESIDNSTISTASFIKPRGIKKRKRLSPNRVSKGLSQRVEIFEASRN